MENKEQIRRIELFLEEIIFGELGKLQKAGLSYMQFVLMGQAIEVLGSFLDHKPMKANRQSSIRFANGINRLFGGRYRLLNDNFLLYDKLRNQMTHTFIPSRDILLLPTADASGVYRHLDYTEGRLVLVADVFYEDICLACKHLITLLREGKVKPKNIVFEYHER